jgi:hypothetical protein
MGFDVSAAVGAGTIVLSATGDALRTAQVGDVIELVRPDGFAVRYTVGLIAPDAAVGGAEVVMSSVQADALGLGATTRVVVFGQFGRDELDAALAAAGLTAAAGVRVSHSWDPASPDGTVGLARTKVLLGEFAYRINSNSSLTLDQAWVDANIVYTRFESVGIRAFCHRAVTAGIQAALDEIAGLGLASLIDVVDTNRYGGCWNPRYARASTTVGAVSRHAWGMALDLNISTRRSHNQIIAFDLANTSTRTIHVFELGIVLSNHDQSANLELQTSRNGSLPLESLNRIGIACIAGLKNMQIIINLRKAHVIKCLSSIPPRKNSRNIHIDILKNSRIQKLSHFIAAMTFTNLI